MSRQEEDGETELGPQNRDRAEELFYVACEVSLSTVMRRPHIAPRSR